MSKPSAAQKEIFICCFSLHVILSFLIGYSSSLGEDLDSKINAALRTEPGNAVLPLDSTLSSQTVKPALIRNRRSNFILDKEHLYGNNAGLDSAFLYNDQIMQNLLNSPPSKPLSYAHSNFFLNYLKPRTTRYNAWDDHSLMHFGKRSLENEIVADKVLVKRSADFVSPNNVLNFGKKSEDAFKDDDSPQNTVDIEIDDIDAHTEVKDQNSGVSNSDVEKEYNTKKSTEPWHSMMSFGKKSQAPWDHNTLHFGKRDEPWHNIMSFGKKSDPWHSMMSFGKKSDNFWDHNTLHFGKKDEPWHNIMSFGKRLENSWDHNTLHFGKRDEWDHNTLHFGKRDPWDHNTLHFGKRDPWDHNTLHFGKRDDPWHSMMSFGKRPDNLWDHNTLHFGKRDDPWHSMMSFGKKSKISDMTDLEKREDPWHNMMSFGKKFDGLWNNSITMIDKRDEPWHSMMSFGKKDDNSFDYDNVHFDKREEPWHSMMSFGKKSGNPWDHNTLHFGKKDEPWHSMMSFGKKSGNPWDHNTLHFGKKDEPWHSMMSFGKKSDPMAADMNFPPETEDYPLSDMMNFEKRSAGSIDNLSEDFSTNYNPWYDHDGMIFYKKSSPWDHNTLHFGKKSNATLESLPTEKANLNRITKRSADTWNDHHTMHFGKKFDPWENHNTMHFGKKSDFSEENNLPNFENENEFNDFNNAERINKKFDWNSHNTMHFGKRDPEDYRNSFQFDKRSPWDYHNTMHFGKRNPWEYHNTMHFGKRYPWDYHNTMHFGKRDPWDYHNTMHFGKRDPWDYHNTMHFGKKSNVDLKDKNNFSTEKNVNQIKDVSSDVEKSRDTFDKRPDKEELSISKRSSSSVETKGKSNNKEIINEVPDETYDNQNFQSQKQPLENVKSTSKPNESVKNDKNKNDFSFVASKREFKDTKSTINENLSHEDHFKKSNIPQVSDKISHIQKRSVRQSSFMNNRNEDSNSNVLFSDRYSKDDMADAVLHFGKRSVEIPNDREDRWFDRENGKRFDDFWNDHNTLHFGKKSDLWDNHNTLHFGKKSDPQEIYSVLPSSKRDPWEYLNTLHFGKKFDPWDGHAQMHFGKRTDNWDYNVMHFGKRKELASRDNDDFDRDQVRNSKEPMKLRQDYSTEDNDFLANLVMLKSIINSNLEDDSLPFEERVNLLRQYLKPIIRAIIDAKGMDLIPFSENNYDANEHMKEGNEEMLEEARNIPSKLINEIRYDEDMAEKGNDDSSYGEYGDNSIKLSSVDNSENLVKTKRKHLGKAELKRYFVPFQGPKSIVYPHAWFASQIRRSSFPRTTDYARHMEMRMAEKKEDPFNSYMHFGRR